MALDSLSLPQPWTWGNVREQYTTSDFLEKNGRDQGFSLSLMMEGKVCRVFHAAGLTLMSREAFL